MRHERSLFALPSTLLLLLVALPPCPVVSEPSWPYNLPAGVKYFPDDEVHIKRNAEVMEKLAGQAPVGVRKMSGDEGEKFFLDYWQFHGAGNAEENRGDHATEEQLRRRAAVENDLLDCANISLSHTYLPPLLLHGDWRSKYEHRFRFFSRSNLHERQFLCPAGTSSCAGIDRPNSCCATGETCVLVTDTGLGDVACCPAGTSCAGSVPSCDTASGYSSCPGSPNGGCCIPNYTCEGIGCM